MGNTLENLTAMLGQVVQRVSYLKGVNLIYGGYKPNDKMDGVDENMNKMVLGRPTLEFDQRDMNGCPIHLYFDMAGDCVKMYYEFNVKTVQNVLDKSLNAMPMLMTDLSLEMRMTNVDGKITKEKLKHNMLSWRPQVARGEISWKAIDEFFEVKKAFENGSVKIFWNAKVQWVDVSSKEMQENLKKPDYVPQPKIEPVSGTISVGAILPGTPDHVSMFDGVKNLLRWDSEVVESNRVFFMDPFKDDALYFLPQEFRIRALPSNAPDMTHELVSEDNHFKALVHFGMAPYVHPKAKRNLYKIFFKRKKKEYCEIRYGGYKSARFDRSGSELEDGNLFGVNGIKLITDDKDIKATPESSFDIVLELPNDGLVELLHEKIMVNDDVGICLGNVYFKVNEGLNGDEEKELGPIPVRMNLHKLASLQPYVTITECKWPNYVAKITNTGLYPIEIGNVAMSVLRHVKNQVKDVKHELECSTAWPKILAKGESMEVTLSDDQVKKIKHRRFPLFWKVKEDYWTEFICEPYHIRLLDENLREILDDTCESTCYEYEEWMLKVVSNFDWRDYPDMISVQVEIRHQYGMDKIITLTEDQQNISISMVPNLNAKLKTQKASERNFEFRVRTFIKNGPKDIAWGEWNSDMGDELYLYNEDLDTPKQ